MTPVHHSFSLLDGERRMKRLASHPYTSFENKIKSQSHGSRWKKNCKIALAKGKNEGSPCCCLCVIKDIGFAGCIQST
jgi:hypothetical protein